MLKIALVAAAIALTACDAAVAQAPPMDMSWAIQSQMRNQRAGDAAARRAFKRSYRMLRRARAAGHPYNGTLVLGNHPNTFGDGGYGARSKIHSQALYDHDMRATRGCTRHVNSHGRIWYAC